MLYIGSKRNKFPVLFLTNRLAKKKKKKTPRKRSGRKILSYITSKLN